MRIVERLLAVSGLKLSTPAMKAAERCLPNPGMRIVERLLAKSGYENCGAVACGVRAASVRLETCAKRP